jgi:hypothetical protein
VNRAYHCFLLLRFSSQALSLLPFSVRTKRNDDFGRDRNDVRPSSSSVVGDISPTIRRMSTVVKARAIEIENCVAASWKVGQSESLVQPLSSQRSARFSSFSHASIPQLGYIVGNESVPTNLKANMLIDSVIYGHATPLGSCILSMRLG